MVQIQIIPISKLFSLVKSHQASLITNGGCGGGKLIAGLILDIITKNIKKKSTEIPVLAWKLP